ncbi:MAG TPA: hypothetical protein VHH36_00275 [Candidatus Thermoplasmatota archaeon]|nr:hypothetical protein [Candidatus Thermoplasmatota archaeon]
MLTLTAPPATVALGTARVEAPGPAGEAIEAAGAALAAAGAPAPLLAQQALNLRTAQALLDALARPPADDLARAVALAKIASRHQAETLGLAWEPVEVVHHDSPSAALLALAKGAGVAPTDAQIAQLRALDDLDPALRDALTRVVDAFLAFDDAAAGADLAPILPARNELLDAVVALRDALRETPRPASAASTIDMCPAFAIDLAGTADAYQGDHCTLIVDAGGDDRYRNNAGGAGGNDCPSLLGPRLEWTAAAVVDLGDGIDEYGDPANPQCGANGGCFGGGAGFLLDGGGGDVYDTDSFGTNGGGYGGCAGFLLDVGGDDTYDAGSWATNGGGSAGGLGALLDLGGDDNYVAGGIGTHGGGAAGAGFLLDAGGHDVYVALDEGTNGGANLGSGFLLDALGNDEYVAGVMGTNGGAWAGGKGFLLDARGTDAYAGTNGSVDLASVGLLFDGGGMGDSYQSSDGDMPSGTDQTISLDPSIGLGVQVDVPLP